MTVLYGLRTRDAANAVTLDTTVTSVRSLKMFTVTGTGGYNQYFDIPDIKASSFVVVDALYDSKGRTWSPQAFWTDGQLHLRAAGTRAWQVMILADGGGAFAASDTYGIRVRNGNIKTQIDSVNKVLGIKYGGTFEFGMYWRPGMQAIISDPYYFQFPTPITTYERPMVFLNAENYMMVSGFYVSGTPGNWTGWGIGHASVYYRQHGLEVSDYMKIKWFLASYKNDAPLTDQYGAVVRDASNQRIFSSTDNLALLSGQPSSNAFYNDGQPIIIGATYNESSRMSWTGSFSDYVLANALFSQTNIEQTTNPIVINWGGFLPGNRSIIKMYAQRVSSGTPVNGISANGRTMFASQPMKPLF